VSGPLIVNCLLLFILETNRIIVETDSPYLAPTPYRGKRNESAYVQNVIRELSYIYNMSEKEVIEFTTVNALKLFNL